MKNAESSAIPTASRTRLARRLLMMGLALAAILALSGLRYVTAPSDRLPVARWSSGGAEAIPAPAWRFCPWPACRVITFPMGTSRVSIRAGVTEEQGDIRSREGAGLIAAGSLMLAPEPSRAADLVRAFPSGWPTAAGDDIARLLDPFLKAHAAGHGFTDLVDQTHATRAGLMPALAEAVARLGLSLQPSSVLRFYPATGRRSASGAGSAPVSRRVLLIGLDGADWEIIDPLMEQGRMPNLKRLVDGGARARLRTITPVLSPIIWTSIATGVGPDRHGIVDFLATSKTTGNQIPVTSNMRRVKALWNILSDNGRTSGIVGWWATWPAEEVRGFIVSDRVAYQLFGYQDAGAELRRRTWPEALGLVIQPDIVSPAQVSDSEVALLLPAGAAPGPDADDMVQKVRTIIASSKTYVGVSRDLMAAYEPDFKAVYLEGTDTIAHNFMRYRPPAMPGVSTQEIAAYGDVVDRYYEYTDTILGGLMATADDDTVVAICSDHGFRSGSNRPPSDPRIERGGAADWHRRFGVLVLAGPGIRKGVTLSDASILDITPTLLALMGLPVAKDMTGKVVAEAFEGVPAPAEIATYESAPSAGAAPASEPVGSELDDEIIAKLTALGYVSQEGSNALNNTGITLMDRGRFSEAAEVLGRAIQQDPGFLQARINLGRAKMLMKDFDGAIATLNESLRLNPAQAEVQNLLGNIHMERGENRQAEASFKKSLQIQPDDTNALNSLGLLYEKMGRDDEAIRQYERVVAIDHDYAEGYNNIGLIHRKRGNPAKAIELFQQAIQADPEFPGSYNNMGLAYQDLGRLGDARRAHEQGLKVDPDNAVILNNLGTIDLAEKDLDAAQTRFEAAIHADPEYPSAYNNLGAVLGMRGKRKEAFDQYLKAVELDPKYTDARFNLARSLLEDQKVSEAVEMLGKVLAIDPRYGRALLQLGIIRAQQGSLDEAIRLLTGAVAAMPEAPDPHNFLAEIYLKLGRKSEAAGEMTRSLALMPDQPQVRRMLDSLGDAGGSR